MLLILNKFKICLYENPKIYNFYLKALFKLYLDDDNYGIYNGSWYKFEAIHNKENP